MMYDDVTFGIMEENKRAQFDQVDALISDQERGTKGICLKPGKLHLAKTGIPQL